MATKQHNPEDIVLAKEQQIINQEQKQADIGTLHTSYMEQIDLVEIIKQDKYTATTHTHTATRLIILAVEINRCFFDL